MMDIQKQNGDKLREACCYGDNDAILALMAQGTSVNSQHDINGWTGLHWACKRGKLETVRLLLSQGADPEIENNLNQRPSQLSQDSTILHLLGVESGGGGNDESTSSTTPTTPTPTTTSSNDAPLPITPNYLAYPPINYKVPVTNHRSTIQPPPRPPPANGGVANGLPESNGHAIVGSHGGGQNINTISTPHMNSMPNMSSASHMTSLPNMTSAPHLTTPSHNAGFPQIAPSPHSAISPHVHSSGYQTSLPPQDALARSSKEVVLKVRIAHTDDPDFIEVEFERSRLNYSTLLTGCCRELALNPQMVERIRKLPNTRLRNDRDCQRLANYIELELVTKGVKGQARPIAVVPKGDTSSTSKNNYKSIQSFKNQTILY